MKEETYCIYNNQDLIDTIYYIEEKLSLFGISLFINLRISQQMFLKTFKTIIPKIKEYDYVFIKGINVTNNNYQIFDVDNLPLVTKINKKTIIKFKICKEMVIDVYDELIVLNEIEGEVNLKTEKSCLIAKKIINARLSTIKSMNPNYSMVNAYIKGDQLIWKK